VIEILKMDKKEFEELKKRELSPILFEVGAGVMDSQALEYDIRYLIFIIADLKLIEFTKLNIDEIVEGNTKHTIGMLIKILRDKIEIETSDDEIFDIGIRSRNNLIHHYLMDNIQRLTSAIDREGMVLEIRKLRRDVRKADSIIKRFIEELLPAYGLSSEKYMEMAKDDFLNSIPEPNE
jgi:hypothetical protein